MGNLDFSNQPEFSWYCVALLVSGLMCLGLTAAPQDAARRGVSAVLGAVMLGYGVYLAFISTGGTYYVFWYVFILPVVLVFRLVSGNNAAKQQQAAARARKAQQAQYAAQLGNVSLTAPTMPAPGAPAPQVPAAGTPQAPNAQ